MVLASLGGWAILDHRPTVTTGVFWTVQVLLVFSVAETCLKVWVARSVSKYLQGFPLETLLIIVGLIVDCCAIFLNLHGLVIIWCTFCLLRLFQLDFFVAGLQAVMAAKSLFLSTLPALIAIYMMFGWTGIYLLGGQMYLGNPLLQPLTYHQSGYYTLNWNDLPSALVSQFVLLVGNNGFILQDAGVALKGWAMKAYFMAFWLLCVLVMLNLFFAMVFQMVDFARKESLHARKRDPGCDDSGSEGDANNNNGDGSKEENDDGIVISLKDGVYSRDLGKVVPSDEVSGRPLVQFTRGNSAIFSKTEKTLRTTASDTVDTQVILSAAAQQVHDRDSN